MKFKMLTDSPAFEEGFQAGIEGKTPNDCPHEGNSKEWKEWQRARHIGSVLYPPEENS